MVFSVFGRRFLTEFPEYAVKLRKTDETAFKGDIGDLILGIDQKELAVADPYQMDIMGNGITSDPFKLMGQVIRTHVGFL